MHWMTCFLYGNQFYNTRKHWRCSLLPEIFTSEGSTGCYAWSKRWKEHNDDLLLYLFCLIIFHLFEEVWRDSVFRLRFFFCISPVGTLAVTELSLHLFVSRTRGHQAHRPSGLKKRGEVGGHQWFTGWFDLVLWPMGQEDPWTHAPERGKRGRAGRWKMV